MGPCPGDSGLRVTRRGLRLVSCLDVYAACHRSCWYPWLVVFCFMLPCRPCSAIAADRRVSRRADWRVVLTPVPWDFDLREARAEI